MTGPPKAAAAWEKRVHWVEPGEARELERALEADDQDVMVMRKAACLPLSAQFDIAIVPAGAVTTFRTCRRQLSWYEASPFAGRSLVVSSSDLSAYGLTPETVIREARDFVPPRMPDRELLRRLADDPAYRSLMPARWREDPRRDPALLASWLRILGATVDGLGDLLTWHDANHGNFVRPALTVPTPDGPAPYSIGPTRKVCSACLEMYNIVGREHARKFVVPCPGAVLFARLSRDRYYEVIGRPGG